MKARFCYQTVTPESAEHGDFADHGFYLPGGWKFSLNELGDKASEGVDLVQDNGYSLRDVIQAAKDLGIQSQPDADWFYSHPSIEDYSTGEEVSYSLHIEGVTDSTYGRIARLLGGR